MNIYYRQAKEEDNNDIRLLLQSQNLPTESIGAGTTDFYLAIENNNIVGVAGFEYYGDDALLRSVAVPTSLQNKGIGSRLSDWMIALAKQQGKQRIVLLTTTASKFFIKKGFSIVDRSSILNDNMKRSSQFNGGCCSSAACMVLNITS